MLQPTPEMLLAHDEHDLSCFTISLQPSLPRRCSWPAGRPLQLACRFVRRAGQTLVVSTWWCPEFRVCCAALPTPCGARAMSCTVPALAAVGGVALLRTPHADKQEMHAPSQGLWPRTLPDIRFGVMTWHAACQRVAVAQCFLRGREQLGRRPRSSFQHLQSPRGLSSPAVCQVSQTIL